MMDLHEMVIVTDVEGEQGSLIMALREAGVVDTVNERVTDVRSDVQLLNLGDSIDRGASPVGVLNILLEVWKKAKLPLISLIGNHELFARMALVRKTAKDIFRWVEQASGDRTLLSFFHAGDCFPGSRYEFPVPLSTGMDTAQERWNAFVEKRRIPEECNLAAAFLEAEKQLLRGKYRHVFDQGRIVHRMGPVLFVHAGIDECLARVIAEHGVETVNRDYRSLRRLGEYAPFCVPEGIGATLSRRPKDNPGEVPLSPEAADLLSGAGYSLVIHGHTKNPGTQSLVTCGPVRVLNANVNVHAYEGSFVRIHRDGDVGVWSRIEPKEKILASLGMRR